MINSWEELKNFCINCEKCELHKLRHNAVIGEGDLNATVMFIGEGPGADEDEQGIPFVGKAGKLMNMALAGIGIRREDIYITNIVKCRPPANRDPLKEEQEACIEYLESQINLINPKIIVLLGSVALKKVLGEQYGITKDRGKWIEKNGIKYIATYHPAALLRDENKKIDFWTDVKQVKKEMQ